MISDLKTQILEIISNSRDLSPEQVRALIALAKGQEPDRQKASASGELPRDEGATREMLRSRLEELQADARQKLESALKGVDPSSASPSKPEMHPAKVQAARAQAAYLATTRASQLKPMAYLAETQAVAFPYLAQTGTQLHPGKIQAARVQAAYLAMVRTARPAAYLATTATSLHPMKVQAARAQVAYLGTARTATATRAPLAYLAQPSAQASKAELHPGKVQAARAQAAYLATARTARPAATGLAPYLATTATTLHPMKVQAARAQAAYLTTTRTIAQPAVSIATSGIGVAAYLAAPYLATISTQIHPGKVQAARAQVAYLATTRSVQSSGQPSPPEVSGGGEPSTPQRGEIPEEVRNKINELVRLQKAIKALGDI